MQEDIYNIIENNLRNNNNFCFLRMNDGEMSCIDKSGNDFSRGFQKYDEKLSEQLIEAINYKDENYFLGIPCSLCYNHYHNVAKKYVDKYINANLLINSNFNKTLNLLKEVLPNKNIVLICNENADTNKLFFKPSIIFNVPSKNCWDYFEKLKDLHSIIEKDTVVIFCCGPLGRVLAYEWYHLNKNITCLEMGSFFDPWTQKKAYMYHTAILPCCSECNPVISESIPDDILLNCVHLERFYYPIPNYNLFFIQNLYNNNWKQIRNFYLICKQNIENQKLLYHCDFAFLNADFKINDYSQEYICSKINELLIKYPNRSENIFYLSNYISDKNLVVDLLLKIRDIPIPTEDEIFIDKDIYLWKILDEIVVKSYYCQRYEESYENWEILMERKEYIPETELNRCIANGNSAKSFIKDKSYDTFLKKLDNIVNNIKDERIINCNNIPKIFHFIYIEGEHPFVMAHFIAIKSCFNINKPYKIYMWYSLKTNNMKTNKWWKLIEKYCEMIEIIPPTNINNHNIFCAQHQADVMRINILNKMGGIYMDIDILSLNPLDGTMIIPQFENINEKGLNLYDKDLVMCRESEIKLCNCVIMSRKNSKFLEKWIKGYENEYGNPDIGWWCGLSVVRPNTIHEENPELNITILKTPSFLPFMFCDDNLFRRYEPKYVYNSLVVHLWDTESFKYGWVPTDINYFEEYPETLFTKLFKKYIDNEILDI